LLPVVLRRLGASDQTYPIASSFLWIVLPTNGLMALGMALSSVLRAAGDAKRSMYATLSIAAVTIVLDPLLIFGLDLKVDGAAYTIAVARVVTLCMSYRFATRVHDLLARPDMASLLAGARPFFAIGIPAILTNLAAPLANAFFMS